MIVKISQKRENQIFIYDEEDNLLKSFEIKENLQRALEFLKQLNSVKTTDGVPIYKTKMFKGISVWSFHQHVLFLNFLRGYVKYEEIIKFLIENKVEKVIVDGNNENLKEYLKINKIEVNNDSGRARKVRFFLISSFMKMTALIITFLAFLKILLHKTPLLIYTPDKFSKKHNCDFRFYPVYQYLKERKIPYIEIFHTLLNREFFKNIISRKRLAIYLEVFPVFSSKKWKSREYNLSLFEPHNQRYFQYLLRIIDLKSQKSIRQIDAISWLLKFTKIKKLLAIDDVRYTNELIVACKLNKIKTYGFQHGQFTKYHVGWMNYNIPKEVSITFDKLFVWNKYWKKVLFSYSTQYNEENIEISGLLRELKPIEYKKKEFKIGRMSELKILVPYETFAPKAEVKDYLNRLSSLGVKIFFKPRPDIPYNQQLAEYDFQEGKGIEFAEKINADILLEIDVVGGTYSTFLNEMIFYEKPLFIFETSFDQGHRLIEDNLGFLIKKDFNPSILLDYINNYQSKKNQAWPSVQTSIEETLDSLN